MAAAARRYALTDAQWARIEPLLPGRRGTPGVTARDNRLFVEAVLYRYRAGIPWRDLPERFGDFRKVHRRHSRWSHKGTWATVFETLSAERDNEYAMIDSTIVRCHQHGTGAKPGEDWRPHVHTIDGILNFGHRLNHCLRQNIQITLPVGIEVSNDMVYYLGINSGDLYSPTER